MPISLSSLGACLPSPLRKLARRFVDWRVQRSVAARIHALPGPLAGFRMRGAVPRQYRDGSYEPQVCALLGRLVQPGWHCVDAGAHMGYFSLLLARCAGPTGKVTAFEAHPGNARRLAEHLRMNGLEGRVTVENQAVSDGSAPAVELFGGRNDSTCEWNILGHDTAGNIKVAVLRIPAVSLDAYFAPGVRLDFIKMDIEGAEALALRGLRRILREMRPLILVEFHSEEAWAARAELLSAGYRLFDVERARWLAAAADVPRAYLCLAAPEDRSAALPVP